MGNNSVQTSLYHQGLLDSLIKLSDPSIQGQIYKNSQSIIEYLLDDDNKIEPEVHS